ncbi:hypothetical protein ACFWBG_22110 [Nocardia salmonicida]|uniref:hypothetical protein n=1 Tax=Nocardia salmonicida TaxID=53431 RepID=UPI0036709796
MRTSIFHAKNGRPVFLPQNGGDRKTVLDAKMRFTRFYLDLAHAELGISFGASALSPQTFEFMAEHALKSSYIEITNDPTPATDGDVGTSPLNMSKTAITTNRAPNLDEPMGVAIIGEATVSSLPADLASICRVASLNSSGELMMSSSFEGKIELVGFDNLEVVLILEGKNVQLPKIDYAT